MAAAIIVRPGQGPFKPHALEVAEQQRARVFGSDEDPGAKNRYTQEQQWRSCVLDLHRVLSVAQALFLLLEHNNEPLLRVGVELVCAEEAQKALWWTEEWYDDDERREWFRGVVAEKLRICMANQGQVAIMPEDNGELEKQKEAYDALAKNFQKAQDLAKTFEQAKNVAEMHVREAEERHEESKVKIVELEKTAESLRRELREKKPDTSGEERLAEQLRETEQKVKLTEAQRDKAQEKTAAVEKDLAAAEARAKSELDEAKSHLSKAEEEMKVKEIKIGKLADEIEKLKEELMRAKKAPPPAPKKVEKPPEPIKDDGKDAKLTAMIKKYEAELNRANAAEREVEELNAQLSKVQETLEEVRTKEIPALQQTQKETEERALSAEREVEELRRKLSELDTQLGKLRSALRASEAKHAEYEEALRLAIAGQKPPPVEKPRPVTPPPPPKKELPPPVVVEPKKEEPPPPTGVPEEEYQRKCEALEKALAKIKAQKAEIASLKEQMEALEAKNQKMLKMLHDIKEQLRRVTEIAEKKGAGKLVAQIMAEANVTETLNSEEYTCFNRLYDDAKRRQEKQRRLQEERFGAALAGGPNEMLRGGRGSIVGSPGGAKPSSPYRHKEDSYSRHGGHTSWGAQAQFQQQHPQGNPQDYPPPGAPYVQQPYAQQQFAYGGSSPSSREPSFERAQGRTRSSSPGNSPSTEHVQHMREVRGTILGLPHQLQHGGSMPPGGVVLGALQRPHSSNWMYEIGGVPSQRIGGPMSRFGPSRFSHPDEDFTGAVAGVGTGLGTRAGRMVRPFGQSASHGSLPYAGPAGLPSHGLSAMSLDASSMSKAYKDRSQSPEGRPRRRLIVSQSAPKLQHTEELPPLAGRRDSDPFVRNNEASSTWPGLANGNVRMMMAAPAQADPWRKSKLPFGGMAGRSKKASPRMDWGRNHDQSSFGGKGNTFGGGSNMSGWALTGHGTGLAHDVDVSRGRRSNSPSSVPEEASPSD